MRETFVPTSEVHAYYFHDVEIDGEKLAAAASGYRPEERKPIPAFEIPEELRVNGLKFAIPDGNHRWLLANASTGMVKAAVYGPNEPIDVEAHGLEPFRNADKPDLYRKTIGIYAMQMGILDRMRKVFESLEK